MPTIPFTKETKISSHVTPGEYSFEVGKVTSSFSKAKNEMFTVNLKIEDGKASVFDHLVFSQGSIWKICQFLIAIGLGDGIEEGDMVDIEPDMLTGRSGRVILRDKTWEGKISSEVDRYLDPSEKSEVKTSF